MSTQSDRPSVIVAGSTGLVGRELIKRLLGDKQTGMVHALMRREPPNFAESRRLLKHVVDFTQLPPLPVAHECYIALGTTIKDAGSETAFRAVDLDAVRAVAEAARTAGVLRLALVSALGANAESTVFYNRIKGLAEEAVAGLGFERVVIARPSLLVGNRDAIGQRMRPMERVVLAVRGGPCVGAQLAGRRAWGAGAGVSLVVRGWVVRSDKPGRSRVHTSQTQPRPGLS
jgi:uncharacterized protein YbjT (DUF2867 family)